MNKSPVRVTLIRLGRVVVFFFLLCMVMGFLVNVDGMQGVKQRAARSQAANFAVALDLYYQDTGTYPTSDFGLYALRSKPEGIQGWRGPYIREDIPLDPWGRSYLYKASTNPEVGSFGGDGIPGGSDDNADILMRVSDNSDRKSDAGEYKHQ